jgi:hypothetical protein
MNLIKKEAVVNDEEPHFIFDKMSGIGKRIVYLIIILWALSLLTSDSIEIARTSLGVLIGWFWTGPWCWALAYNKDRNEDFAFIWGFSFGIPGLILYWLFTLFYKKNPNNWVEKT